MVSHNDQFTIDLHDVAKVYRRKVHALRGVEMRVHRGEIFGLLGPNGAGKSTLVKIMMTVVNPTRANGTVLGRPVGHKPTLARVGYLPENHHFPQYLTGRKVLEFYGMLAGKDRRTIRRRSDELLDLVQMRDWADHRINTYSKGMMQRIGLAQALVHDPELVILDEPTDGVDPVGRRDIRDALQELRRRGVTIFLNSHLLSELEMVCDRVAIMVQGRVAQQGTLDELTADQRFYEIEVVDGGDASHAAGDARHSDDLTRIVEAACPPDVERSVDGATVRLKHDDPAVAQPVIDALRRDGRTIRAVRPHRPSLEDLFIKAVTDESTGRTLKPGAEATT